MRVVGTWLQHGGCQGDCGSLMAIDEQRMERGLAGDPKLNIFQNRHGT